MQPTHAPFPCLSAGRHAGAVMLALLLCLTAQPAAEEQARAPHALYGVVPLGETVSAASWRTLASGEIERARAAGRVPILCGGSGLYLRTLMKGIAPIPDAPPELREQANADWAALGPAAFRARLAEHDPVLVGRLKPGDRQRHVRTRRHAGRRDEPAGIHPARGFHPRHAGALRAREDEELLV